MDNEQPVVDVEAQEWDDALSEQYGEEEPTPEPEETTPAETPTPADDKPEEPTPEPEPAISDPAPEKAREQRMVQRQTLAEEQALREDIKTKMFSDKIDINPIDKDGNPIQSPQDLMDYENPQTGQSFTEEEAALYWLNLSKEIAEKKEKYEKQLDNITDLNMSIKDQADIINETYGDFLEKYPNIRDKIWAEYEKTLKRDETTDIIIETPIPLINFYNLMLTPYKALMDQIKQGKSVEKTKDAVVEEKNKEIEKLQIRSDRADITGTNTNAGHLDKEDKEWAEALKEYYNE